MLRIVQKKCVETQITSKIHLKYSQTWALRPRQNSLKKCGDEQIKLPNSSTEAKFHKQKQTMTKFATYTKRKMIQHETVGNSRGRPFSRQTFYASIPTYGQIVWKSGKTCKIKKETKINMNQLETVGNSWVWIFWRQNLWFMRLISWFVANKV